LNTQIAVKRAQLDAEAAEIDATLGDLIDKAMTGQEWQGADLKDLGRRVQEIKDAKADLDRREEAQEAADSDPRITALKMYGGDLGTQPEMPVNKKQTGAQLNPLAFSDASLKASYKAFQNRQPISIKAEAVKKSFSSVDSLLPAELALGIVEHIHEWRILDRLPMISIGAPSYEFLVHNFASDSGTNESAPFAGVVAEGAAKPEYVPAVTDSIATVNCRIRTG
jgi:hypothetical protein